MKLHLMQCWFWLACLLALWCLLLVLILLPRREVTALRTLTPSTRQKFRSSDQDYIYGQIYKVLLNRTLRTVTKMPAQIP